MLDTIMALWNQRRQESRQRAGRIGLVLLLICISVSLLLVVLSGRSAEKSLMDGKKAHQQVVVQPDVTARNFTTPSRRAIPTPFPAVKVARHMGPPRAYPATVVATEPASAPSPSIASHPIIIGGAWSAPRVEPIPVNVEKKQNVEPSAVKRQSRRPRTHKTRRVKVVPIPTIVPLPTSTVTIPRTATATPTPIATPVATATASIAPTATVQDAPPVPFIQPFTANAVQSEYILPKERSGP